MPGPADGVDDPRPADGIATAMGEELDIDEMLIARLLAHSMESRLGVTWRYDQRQEGSADAGGADQVGSVADGRRREARIIVGTVGDVKFVTAI